MYYKPVSNLLMTIQAITCEGLVPKQAWDRRRQSLPLLINVDGYVFMVKEKISYFSNFVFEFLCISNRTKCLLSSLIALVDQPQRDRIDMGTQHPKKENL